MSKQWLSQPERGQQWAYRLMVWVALKLGRKTARVLLHPICLYYLLFSFQATKAIRTYLRRVFDRPVRSLDIFRQYHCFASTLLDRTFLLSGQYDQFELDFHGADILLNRVDRGQGCLLLGAHLGSFEVVRASGLSSRHVPIKLLMHEENAPMLRQALKSLAPSIAQSIIQVGAPDTMLQVKECLDEGGLVGILGDRLVKHDKDKIVECQFLGHPAHFPSGPMLLASILKVPVILFFGLYQGGCRYEIHFELLSEHIILDRQNRKNSLQEWTQRFVTRLEHYCRLAPHNWFNFYDFWEEDT
ncbi:MAG: lipid A biosynthesis acyltransferase [Nitrospirales bacterium]|nr:lipid A biosynthesis acyltransferase [Nitrospirales bacterium]